MKDRYDFKHFDILKEPVVTEKSSSLGAFNKYIFEVDKHSSKTSVTKAIQHVFGVKVKKVNIINQQGKIKKFRGKMGTRAHVKKAIVTLEKDNIIDFTGGIK